MSTDDRLPDPETTEAEAITVPDAEVFDEIPADNPFRGVLEELRDEGHDWGEIFDLMDAAFVPVDHAADQESFVILPEYEIQAVVPDSQATSDERYETFTKADATEEQAIEWVRSKPEVRRVEASEQVGEVKVG
ncbi:hypothetical protein [Natrinema ejinorense]|uniref:Uncharacterized protein n=1 Tax=Natrinema ejinorense TaxID=373386 RepID=A0A2A5QP73_9EURY|nr:hypothetical protein [Natrinema ejinorense]PCR88651.1 hypothetical protein CP557_21710 [Natrinema ejinorense]